MTTRATRHALRWNRPTPRFLEGALLGNGGLGVVVTTRPDSIVVSLGHNSVWDIRLDESHAELVGTFDEIIERVSAIDPTLRSLDDHPWYRDYRQRMEASYLKPYPRPYPCGSLILGFDRRRTEVLGHDLDIATGLCSVQLIHDRESIVVQVFVEQVNDRLWVSVVDGLGKLVASPFTRIRLVPDPDGPASDDDRVTSIAEDANDLTLAGEPALRSTVEEFEQGQRGFGFRETLPVLDGVDTQTAMAYEVALDTTAHLAVSNRLTWYGDYPATPPLERVLESESTGFVLVLGLRYGLSAELAHDRIALPVATIETRESAWHESEQSWQAYWSLSEIGLDDERLERLWYHNTYFLHCALRAGRTCPGLFGNWSYRDIGTAWHGDYHLNYNTQQVFWGLFSSNRIDGHLPYVELVHNLLPVSRMWAKDFYGLSGAYFPHTAYPVEMTTMPYPSPTWGWEICETPWTVQSLWWHFTYTWDLDFLRDRAFEPLRDATEFLVSFIMRADARGEQWGDDRWHIFPTVVPELYGLRPGFAFNSDCLTDITLTKFVLRAFTSACSLLERDDDPLLENVALVLNHLPEYPTADTPDGPVFVSTPGEDPETVYNVPIPGMTVFPGEDHSWESDAETVDIAVRSLLRHRNEGGNDLVFKNLQAARLGVLDLEAFLRQAEYCLIGNGSCTDMVLCVHGRYNDTTPYDFMAGMGVFVENFALTAVINECLLQSYSPTIRVFPNVGHMADARFENLRAAGAFMVSAEMRDGRVTEVDIVSEAGNPLEFLIPWAAGARVSRDGGEPLVVSDGPRLSLTTRPGERLHITEA